MTIVPKAILSVVVLAMAAACSSPAAKIATTASRVPAPVVVTTASFGVPTTPTAVETPTTIAVSALPAAPAGVPVQNHMLTPGAVFAGVTPAQVCVSGYSASVRNVSSAEKTAVFAEYHTVDIPSAYEVDHLISLELGGSNDITNLWPEPYAGVSGARAKDKVENSLHADVCAGRLTLQAAQTEIAADWWNIPALDNPIYSPPASTPATAAPVAAPTTTPAITGGATIICKDGYVWPSTVRQGACHGHHGIG
jgi:hypothetical protein